MGGHLILMSKSGTWNVLSAALGLIVLVLEKEHDDTYKWLKTHIW